MDRDTVVRSSGGVAVGVTMAAILLATLLSPAFRWTGNALSNLGVTQSAAGTSLTVLLFNGGLVLGGAVGLVFSVVLARSLPTFGGRAVGVLFGLAMLAMAAIGVFPQDRPLHFPVAVGFYLLLSLALWADGVVSLRRGWRRRAVAGLALGTVNVFGWVAWGLTGSLRRPGLALPEIVGALALSVWAVWVSAGLVRGRWRGPSKA
ncbi:MULTISPECIES: DUF998 domain-containing protein [Salinibaculum]|uniref:DUF998 domain-containing protein n=1 Tax=Salinibaculum TaxID=2732368 RepID=UPI0030CA904E